MGLRYPVDPSSLVGPFFPIGTRIGHISGSQTLCVVLCANGLSEGGDGLRSTSSLMLEVESAITRQVFFFFSSLVEGDGERETKALSRS